KAAKENLALNPTATNIWIKSNDLLKGVEHKADVIVANILADIIVKMIPDAWRLLKDDGTLIVSGIIAAKKDLVTAAMTQQGFVLDQLFQQKDWLDLSFVKTADIWKDCKNYCIIKTAEDC